MEIIQRGKTEGGYWYEANNISAAEHGGTHMGALHTFEGRWQVDQIPLKHLITPGVVVDVRSKTRNNPDYPITKSDFIQKRDRSRPWIWTLPV
jgi:kynurenine formamidase